MRMGILHGIRGPRGGYELARERRRITADDILRAAGTIEDADEPAAKAGSALLNEMVIPAVAQAERAFSAALSRISLETWCARPSRCVTQRPDCLLEFRVQPATCLPPLPAFTVWTLSA